MELGADYHLIDSLRFPTTNHFGKYFSGVPALLSSIGEASSSVQGEDELVEYFYLGKLPKFPSMQNLFPCLFLFYRTVGALILGKHLPLPSVSSN